MRRAWNSLLGIGILLGGASWASAQQEQPRAQADVTVRGKIVRLEGPDRYIVRTTDNKDVTFYTTPTTRYTIDGRAVKYSDLKVGAEVSTIYTTRENRFYV